jgi:transglutaminase-like putative cysteine protease
VKVRAGYEISYDCPQPTPMILSLNVHPSRIPDLLSEDRMRLDLPILANTYHDSFGNFCHVIRAPAGRLTISADFLVRDKGRAGRNGPAGGAAWARRPVSGGPDLSARQPLLRNRRLSNRAWSLLKQIPRGWPLVNAISDYVHNRITFGYAHASATKTAWDADTERRGVCRD